MTSKVLSRWPFAGFISRKEFFVWVVCGLLTSLVVADGTQSTAQGVGDLLELIASKSVFLYLGCYVVFRLLSEAVAHSRASVGDLAAAFAICAVNFLPGRLGPGLAVTILALYFLVASADPKLRAAGGVLFGLSLNAAWGPRLIEMFSYYVVRIDAALVGSALTMTWPDVSWKENIVGIQGGHSIIIYHSCSSLHNVSLGLLCWVSIKNLVRTDWRRSDVWVGLLVCTSVVALNVGRLYLAALSAENYAYWHGGTGEEIYNCVTTFMVLLISIWGARRGQQSPNRLSVNATPN
jgi:hypothetical protein